MSESAPPTIPRWFAGQHVLITGATGFLGKILVEKLLRCCPDIARIHLLVREKRGRAPSQRLDDFVNSAVFDALRDRPNSADLFAKLCCVNGDLARDNLDLAADDLERLREDVCTVFHMAANVRFDQPLKPALLMNTGGAMKVLDVVATFSKIRAFVHVSTSYCHCEETELAEKTYRSPQDPRKMLETVTCLDEEVLTALESRLIKGSPNTYAYSKCLTEQLVTEYASKFPIAITRPSIVVAAWKEPIPGWIDNLNGPTGLMVGAGKGIIRSMHCNPAFDADLVPVDVCANSIIVTAWILGTSPKSSEPLVVNVTATRENSITWGAVLELGRKHMYDNPFSICLWYPGGSIKSNYFFHMLSVFFFHIVPAYIVDFLLLVARGKPFLVRTQKRITNGLTLLQYYTTRPWLFHNDNLTKFARAMDEGDRAVFYVDMADLNWDDYVLKYVLGARKHCVHEEPDTLPRARKLLKRLYYMDVAKNFILIGLVVWLTCTYLVTILYKMEEVFSKIM